MKILLTYCFSIVLLTSCKQSSPQPQSTNSSPPPPTSISTYEVLLFGNSHSSVNDLPNTLATLIRIGTGETANTDNGPGWAFLDDRLNDGESIAFLESRQWTHLVLQGQKYSTTGQFTYSTDGSKEWIRRAKQQNTVPIMFPEWPRKHNFAEGAIVHAIHESIVSEEAACLAPIGLAWDSTIMEYPSLTLHAADGNHSNPNGALLTAYVLYEVITKQPANDLPFIDSLGVVEQIQTILKRKASETVASHPPCIYLPQ